MKIIYKLMFYVFTCVFAFEDVIYVYGQGNVEMLEIGKQQYQLLKERGTLPRYGKCWQSGLDHVESTCRELNEDSQSDVALHLMNCFLEMSGHETYNCDQDKKHNLRAICINNISDRAFIVYTEFYTHIVNICWFLRGQVWNEIIAENSMHLINHMKVSNRNQEDLIKSQKKSLDMQEKLLANEEHIEKFISDFYTSAQKHQQLLDGLLGSITNLQDWLLGEVSWFNSLIFYMAAIFLTIIFTATKRTYGARPALIILLSANIFVERIIAKFTLTNPLETISFSYKHYYQYVWCGRYIFIILCIIYLLFSAYKYKDYTMENHKLLRRLYDMNDEIRENVKELNSKSMKKYVYDDDNYRINEQIHLNGNSYLNGYSKAASPPENAISLKLNKDNENKRIVSRVNLHSSLQENDKAQYNLRKRQPTPDTSFKH